MKYNPFRPNSIIAPGLFAGRSATVDAIERALFQTMHGNPHHFLVLGERGIGKTSLLYIIEMLAEGGLGEFKPNFLTVSVDLGACRTQLDIVRAIGRQLKAVIAEKEPFQQKAADFWDWLKNWEVLGVHFHKHIDEIDPQEAGDALVSKLSQLSKKLEGEIDGILILIDEADRPDESANLGEFVKFSTERLTRAKTNNVLFGMAGLPIVLSRLRASHESSARVFETHTLEALDQHAREYVIRSGLDEAAKKNKEETKIQADAMALLTGLSEGYPHFLQQFAYCAFEEDSDNVITVRDVSRGAFREDGALAQLGNKYFSEMYHARILSQDYRKVLDAMANHQDKWVSKKDLISETGLKEMTMGNALKSLKAKEVIQADDTRRGFYKLPTKSFAAWINAVKATRSKGDDPPDPSSSQK